MMHFIRFTWNQSCCYHPGSVRNRLHSAAMKCQQFAVWILGLDEVMVTGRSLSQYALIKFIKVV